MESIVTGVSVTMGVVRTETGPKAVVGRLLVYDTERDSPRGTNTRTLAALTTAGGAQVSGDAGLVDAVEPYLHPDTADARPVATV